ncbi:MAG: rod-binding protein [Lachnospiraceae bacterium]|jgi:flagellar protein FlgJ|nr:rod-binding protein [Lachnospiraceae bacterium]
MDISALTAHNMLMASESNSTAKLRESLGTSDFVGSTDEELLAACKEFEAYFLEMVFKEMQKSVDIFSPEKDKSTSQLVDYFRDMTIQKIAADSTERQGLGLAQQLFEQMRRNYGLPVETDGND